jgi:Family of unknown function (DUF6226)
MAGSTSADCVNWFPDCGCDAWDSGSENELDHLDVHMLGIVTGSFRRLSSGKRVITVLGDDDWNASGFHTTARLIRPPGRGGSPRAAWLERAERQIVAGHHDVTSRRLLPVVRRSAAAG